jgi:hypothetical protein
MALSIVFLGIQVFLWFAWWCLVRSQASGLATAEVILCSMVLYFAHVIGTSLVLGWAGSRASGPLVLLTLLFLPHRSAAYTYYAADTDRFREAFSDEHVTIAKMR